MAKRHSGYVKSTSLKIIRSRGWYADTEEERDSRKPLGKAKRVKPVRTPKEQKLHDAAIGISPIEEAISAGMQDVIDEEKIEEM